MNSAFLSRLLGKLRSLTLKAFLSKSIRHVWHYLSVQVERFWFFLFPTQTYFRELEEQWVFPHSENTDVFTCIEKTVLPRLLISAPLHRELFVKTFENPEQRTRMIQAADNICAHRFDFLGSGPVEVGAKIPWHTDFKSGKKWGKTFHKALWVYSPFDDSDVKIPWELSRFQHVTALGKAFWLTHKISYWEEARSQVSDWMDSNPVRIGVNWKCAMDVALRAVSWTYFFGMFFPDTREDDKFWKRFLTCMFDHGRFIRSNLEYSSAIRGNHYISNLTGLAYLGSFFKEHPEGREWLDFAAKELIAEMEFQVFPDGTNFEMSTAYHHLVLELFVGASLSTVRSESSNSITPKADLTAMKQRFGVPWVERLERMFHFLHDLIRPDGASPLIGDHDDGRLHILANYGGWKPDDFRHLLHVGGVLFDNPDWLCSDSEEGVEEAWWMWPGHQLRANPDRKSRAFAHAYTEGGYYIAAGNGSYLIVRAGDVGMKGWGGHAHCDALSFELCLGGEAVVIDPGCYIYTADPKARCSFRSTASHNVLQIDGEELNAYDGFNLFQMEGRARPTCSLWETVNGITTFEGSHSAFDPLDSQLSLKRTFSFHPEKQQLSVRDLVNAKASHRFAWTFHFSPQIKASLEKSSGGTSRVVLRGTHASYELRCGSGQGRLEEGAVSRSYGSRVKAPVFCYELNGVPSADECFEFSRV